MKWYPDLFEGDMISVTEKIHGTNFRAGWVPNYPKNWLQKFQNALRLLPKWEFTFGSHNVQLQAKKTYTGFYEENVYEKIVNQYNLKTVLHPGEVLYGEIVGNNIQANYTYGCKPGEYKLVVFDMKQQSTTSSEYLSVDDFQQIVKLKGLESCPILYQGSWDKELVYRLTKGRSVYCPDQPVREGIVVKSLTEESCHIGRKVLKLVSEEYLADHTNTDEH